MTIKCHEFLECNELECAMFKDGEQRNCWEVEPVLTPCFYRMTGSIKPEKKVIFCRNCFYYKYMYKIKHSLPSTNKLQPHRPCYR